MTWATLPVGLGMMVLTVMLHTVGVVYWLERMGTRIEYLQSINEHIRLFRGVWTTALALLVLHLLEAVLWALLYMALPAHAGLKNFHDAVYFSMITFTTLGYGDVTLSEPWQVLAGAEGMVGIVVFGLTTALLYAVIQKCWRITHDSKAARPKTQKPR
jgi:voltage-gated potassium channel Kch